jgi:histidinol phosphatase-like enzyme (inositol monophosphatase family)
VTILTCRQTSLDELLDLAISAAHAAGEVTLRYFQKNLAVETKADLSPVTIADRESERTLRQRIERCFPDHGILGEEFGAVRDDAAHRWMLDPLDGTLSFIRGVPLYGVMVGLEDAGEPKLGVVHFPALGETVWARRGGGAWWNGRRAKVSEVARLADATLVTTDLGSFAAAGFDAAYRQLRVGVKLERTWGDCYGHMLVATGRAEVMVDPILEEWDACALLPILEEAGGRFTDWHGSRTIYGGSAISSNGLLHNAVMQLVAEQ